MELLESSGKLPEMLWIGKNPSKVHGNSKRKQGTFPKKCSEMENSCKELGNTWKNIRYNFEKTERNSWKSQISRKVLNGGTHRKCSEIPKKTA